MDTPFTREDLDALRRARDLLDNPGLAARLTHALGSPIEQGLKYLPAGWHERIGEATRLALAKAADAALFTLGEQPGKTSSDRWHKLGVAVAGGVGGFFGLACLEVFALGGSRSDDDAAVGGYYAARALLARAVSQAAQYAGGSVALEKAAPPALARLIALVAERFGVQITEKAAAQAVPALGAVGGAVINTLFIDHFQDMARGHFTVRRLEGKYGREAVRQAYDGL